MSNGQYSLPTIANKCKQMRQYVGTVRNLGATANNNLIANFKARPDAAQYPEVVEKLDAMSRKTIIISHACDRLLGAIESAEQLAIASKRGRRSKYIIRLSNDCAALFDQARAVADEVGAIELPAAVVGAVLAEEQPAEVQPIEVIEEQPIEIDAVAVTEAQPAEVVDPLYEQVED